MDDFLEEILGEGHDVVDLKKEDEVLAPLLDEINLIEDQGIHSFIRSALYRAPDYFWIIPSSFSGKYHPPDERSTAGNVLHTKRVVRLVKYIAVSQDRSEWESDVLVAAALLHDVLKGARLKDGTVNYDPMHAYTVDRFIDWVRKSDETSTTEVNSSSLWIEDETVATILRLVRCHMGRWSPIPETIPATDMDWTLHLADMIASKLHHIIDGEDIQEWRWVNPSEE